MRKIFYLLTFALLMICGCGGGGQGGGENGSDDPSNSTGTITGQVFLENRDPAVGAIVSTDSGMSTLTDNSGRFKLKDITSGRHDIAFTKDEYSTRILKNVYVSYGETKTLSETVLSLYRPPLEDVISLSGETTFYDDILGFGSCISSGDVNGDGFDDILVSAHGPKPTSTSQEQGKVYLFFGRPGLDLDTEFQSAPDSADVTFTGGGLAPVSAAGDVNGDGYNDILIGEPHADRVYLIYGSDSLTDMSLSDADFTFNGPFAGSDTDDQTFGLKIESAGDLNGDGFDDIIIGTTGFSDTTNSYRVQAYMYKGSEIITESANNKVPFFSENVSSRYAHVEISASGDVNGDGFDDILFGVPDLWYPNQDAYLRSGRAYLFYGGSDFFETSYNGNVANMIFSGNSLYDDLGSSVSIAGDVNGDGYDDILIGARGVDHTSTGGVTIDGTIDGEPVESGSWSHVGSTYLFYGFEPDKYQYKFSASEADGTFLGRDSDDSSGSSVSIAGDVNGDGYDDILIGAPYANRISTIQAGAAYLIYGSCALNDRWLGDADVTFSGTSEGDLSGGRLTLAGDVNGDGYNDILIGASGTRKIYLVMGREAHLQTGGDNCFDTGGAPGDIDNGGAPGDIDNGGAPGDIDNGGAPGDIDNYFPHALGDTWTYKWDFSNDFDTVSIIEVNGNEWAYKSMISDGSTIFSWKTYYNGTVSDVRGEVIDPYTTTTVSWSPPALYFATGLAIGETITRASTVEVDFDGETSTQTWTVTLKGMGYEDVTVPAGFFPEAYKIESSVIVNAGGFETTNISTQWFATGVGFIKSESEAGIYMLESYELF